MKNTKRKNKGITLIALVITIIVLLILAGVTIVSLSGDNGIIKKAGLSKENSKIGEEKEIVTLSSMGAKMQDIEKGIILENLQKELDNHAGVGKTVATEKVDEEVFLIKFLDSGRTYKVGKNGEDYTVPEFSKKANEAYARALINEISAYGRNPQLAKEAKKYKKYFAEVKPEKDEDFLMINADAIGKYLIAMTRNPSQSGQEEYNKIMNELTYKEKIPAENYTNKVRAAYMKNTGKLMYAYMKNPSQLEKFVKVVNDYNPFVEATLDSGYNMDNLEVKMHVQTNYDKKSEEIKAVREEIVGDLGCGFKNPNLYQSGITMMNKIFPLIKSDKPSLKEQASAVKTIGKILLGYARSPSLKNELLINDDCLLKKYSSLVVDKNSEEVQIARAETLEILIAAMQENKSLVKEVLDYFYTLVGEPTKEPSSKVQAISLYNRGNLIENRFLNFQNSNSFSNIVNQYAKIDIEITEKNDEIQAASLANLGRLYFSLPRRDDETKETILNYFRTKLYVKPTSNSPIVQAAKYYSDGYYDASYQEIIKIEDKKERERELKILEEIRKEFSPNIEIDFSLEEVQIAKIDFLKKVYESYSKEGGRYFMYGIISQTELKPSEEYFRRK